MREHRLCYSSPAPNVESGVLVGVCFVSAGQTPKHGLTGAIALVDMSARRALAAGVARIDRDHRDACHCSLIFDKATKLSEAPVVQSSPQRLIDGLSPFADTFEIFNGNRTTGAFCFGNDLTRDVVVDPLLKPALSAAQFPQPTFRGSCTFFLQDIIKSFLIRNAFNIFSALC